MKKKYYLTILFLSILLYGCNNDTDNTLINNKINSYYFGYVNTELGVMINPDNNNLVKLDYKGDDIIKRIGKLIPVNSATGYNYKFTEKLYQELVYNRQTTDKLIITIIEKSNTNEIQVAPNEKNLKFNEQNQIIEKVLKNTSENLIDTINYSYNSKGQLIKSIKKKEYNSFTLIETSDYYYSVIQNLDSVITKSKYNDELIWSKKEIFSDYDQASNPLKDLIIFEDTFYRSLSKNNFAKYQVLEYDENDVLTSEKERNWSFFYDNLGNINLSKN